MGVHAEPGQLPIPGTLASSGTQAVERRGETWMVPGSCQPTAGGSNDEVAAPRSDVLGVLISGFPRLSETFILNEILELERHGVRLVLFPLKPGQTSATQPEVELIRSPIYYVPTRIGLRVALRAFGTLAGSVARAPLRTGRTLARFTLSGRKEREYGLLKSFFRWLWLCRQFRRHRLVAIHAHFAHDPATLAYWAAELLCYPYSFTAHAKDIYCYPQDWLRQKIHRARFVVTCTTTNRDFLRQLCGNGTPIHRLYHGIDVHKFRPVPKKPTATPLVLAVGRLVQKKGFAVLLQSCALLKQWGVPFRCVIVGEGPLRQELRDRIGQLKLAALVGLHGALTHDRLIAVYRSATVFVMPCCVTEDGDRDGIPNALLEAMATELPVVATRVSGIPEAVEDGKTGLLVEERDPHALAEAIRRILEDPHLALRLGAAARDRVVRHFNLHQNVLALAKLIQTSGSPSLDDD